MCIRDSDIVQSVVNALKTTSEVSDVKATYVWNVAETCTFIYVFDNNLGSYRLGARYNLSLIHICVAMTYSEAQAYLDGGTAPEQSQISREIDWFLQFYQGIQPAMCICYDRLALFDKYQPELRLSLIHI